MTDQPGHRHPEPNGNQPGEPADPWAGVDEPQPSEPQPSEPQPSEPGPSAQPSAAPPGAGDAQTVQRPAAEGDETQPYSAVDATAVAPASPRWSGRAQVPPPNLDERDVAQPSWPEPADWSDSEVQRRGVATPVLLTAVALILLLLIGIGAYLVLNGSREAPVTPPPTTPPGLTATTVAPTTPPQTTTPPPTTTVAPVQVEVPTIAGIDYPSALAALTQRGLRSSPVNEPSQDVPAGSVIRTDPVAGTQVESGSVITVVVSTGPPQTTEASPSPSPTQ